ncbi:MAG TPA: MBL fold metallo-hydrolase [Spirochaetota bacterium]|nr:MBL fold metallo-hydrolase [Spirochaetota bacterium]HPJ34917.1 MBL fold metallo-hydrolase [Spirochaetota bacterium]
MGKERDFRVKFWGVRGSIPTPGKKFIRYGGNTPCVEVRCGDTLIIIDAGSGLRELGDSLLQEFNGRKAEIHMLISHTHWDHIQGFPFFKLAYIPGTVINFYGGHSVSTLEKLIFGQMEREYFPVSLNELQSTIGFNALTESPFKINDVTIYFTHLIHPTLSLGFRIEYRGRVFVYATDSEISLDPEIEKINEKNLSYLMHDADAVVADCQYDMEEYENKAGWGHSAIEKTVEICNKFKVKNLFAFHHDPSRTDDQLDELIIKGKAVANPGLNVYPAKEKQMIFL